MRIKCSASYLSYKHWIPQCGLSHLIASPPPRRPTRGHQIKPSETTLYRHHPRVSPTWRKSNQGQGLRKALLEICYVLKKTQRVGQENHSCVNLATVSIPRKIEMVGQSLGHQRLPHRRQSVWAPLQSPAVHGYLWSHLPHGNCPETDMACSGLLQGWRTYHFFSTQFIFYPQNTSSRNDILL